MKKKTEIRELRIVVVANNHNPSILNPDFLKYNNIIPMDWELKKAPICVEPISEVAYMNDVTITAQIDRLTFFQKLNKEDDYAVIVDEVANKYINTLPHVEYRAVGINFAAHIPYEGNPEGPKNFILENLIADGPWCEYGYDRKASITFNYELKRAQFNLTVKDSNLKIDKNEKMPVLLFDSNFHHQLIGEDKVERLKDLHHLINNWGSCLEEFKSLISVIYPKEA